MILNIVQGVQLSRIRLLCSNNVINSLKTGSKSTVFGSSSTSLQVSRCLLHTNNVRRSLLQLKNLQRMFNRKFKAQVRRPPSTERPPPADSAPATPGLNPFYPVSLMMGVFGLALFTMICKGPGIREFANQFMALKDPTGSVVFMKRKVAEEWEKALKASGLLKLGSESYWNFGLGNTLKPSVESCIHNDAGCVFLLPVTMNLMLPGQTEEEDNLDIRKFCELSRIDYDSLDSDTQSELASTLRYSEVSRKFVQKWLFHTADSRIEPGATVGIVVVLPVVFTLLAFSAFNLDTPQRNLIANFHKLRLNSPLPVTVGLVFGLLTAYSLLPETARIRYLRAIDEMADSKASFEQKEANKELLEGGKEFFHRTDKLEKLVQKLSPEVTTNVILRKQNFWEKWMTFDYGSSKFYTDKIDEKLRTL